MTKLVPDTKTFDFGTIKEKNGPVRHTFRLTNRSRETLFINEANSWCGCTVAKFSSKPILAGGSTSVEVSFDPKHRQGRFNKEIILILNNGKYYARLVVKGAVIPLRRAVEAENPYHLGQGLYASLKKLSFNELPVGKSYTHRFRIANSTNRPMTVEFRRRPDNRVLKMPEQLTLKPYEQRTIYVKYTYYRERHFDRHVLIDVWVNGQQVTPIRIQWHGQRKRSH